MQTAIVSGGVTVTLRMATSSGAPATYIGDSLEGPWRLKETTT
jgi:hypothetical protein